MITLGDGGLLFMSAYDGGWYAQAPSVQVVSSVGSGDAFLGGLAIALDNGKDLPDALCDAVAAGTANAPLQVEENLPGRSSRRSESRYRYKPGNEVKSVNHRIGKVCPKTGVRAPKGPHPCFRVLFITFVMY